MPPIATCDQTSSFGEPSASSRTGYSIRHRLESFNLVDPCKLNGTITELSNSKIKVT